MKPIANCELVDLPVAEVTTGRISVVENASSKLFEVKRVFFLYDIPAGQNRGAHAHRLSHQLIVAAFGSFSVKLFDGTQEQVITLNKPFQALYIPPMVWASQEDFSGGAVCLVCASHLYDESDYIRDKDSFIHELKGNSKPIN